jgi:hypothetical protein
MAGPSVRTYDVCASRHRERLRLYSSVPYRYKSVAAWPELSSNPEQLAMTRYQLLLLPVVAGAILVLGGALNQKPATAGPLLVADGQRSSDPQALDLLDRAVATLAPERVRWLECTVWQQGMCEDFSYQACGRLLTAPAERCRFDLNVKVGKTVGELRLACDGKTLCQSLRMSGDKAVVTLQDLPGVKDKFKTPLELELARAQFLEDNGGRGLGPMVRGLRRRMQGAQYVHCRWRGRDVFAIAGAVPEEQAAATMASDFVAARFKVRQVVLFLDAQTLWPDRVEWWGADRPSGPSRLLLQTEFRNPVLNEPLSAERCAAEFAVAPG